MSKQPDSATRTSAILVVIVFVLGALVFFQYRDKIQLPSVSFPKLTKQAPVPTPTPTALIQGKETYSISQSSDTKGPKIQKLTLDPLDVANGGLQTIIVETQPNKTVDSVNIALTSDNKTRTLVLEKQTDGVWKTQWTLDDSVLYKYILVISATGGGQESSVTVAPRQ